MKRRDSRQAPDEPAYGAIEAAEGEPLELGDVLEPYGEADDDGRYDDMPQPGYGELYDDYDPYDDSLAEHEDALDAGDRFRVAMSVFNVVSILVGVAVILLLSALLISLLTWLNGDIRHSVLLIQSNLQS